MIRAIRVLIAETPEQLVDYLNYLLPRDPQGVLDCVWATPEKPQSVSNRASPQEQTLMTVVKDEDKGRYALSHVRTICFDGKLSAALVRIETGRTHQIRVHLKERDPSR